MTEKTDNTTTAGTTGSASEPSETARIVNLVIGDALVFLVFAVIGLLSHGRRVDLSTLPDVVRAAAPFAIGWFIVAPLTGAYRRDLTTRPRQMAIRTAFSWVLAWPVGLALRGIFIDHGVPPYTFALITLLFNLVVLLLWRWPYALTKSLNSAKKS